MLKIALIAGTRPEVIKLAPLQREMHRRGWQPYWVSTNQQAELNTQALTALNIVPDFQTPAPDGNGSLAVRLAQIVMGLDAVFASFDPDLVVVQGDTTSTAAGAIAAFSGGRRLAHVEAGLRTGDLTSPFPEEGWRRLVTQFADLHFAPTERAAASLRAEATPAERILVTGNTGIDEIMHMLASQPAPTQTSTDAMRIMVTLHRRELWAHGLEPVLSALLSLRDHYPEIEIDFVLHANPALRERVIRVLGNQDRVTLHEPLDYPAFLNMMRSSYLILSDSGGVQEEAPVFGVPVLVLRDTTERQEAVEAGVAMLVGAEPDRIIAEAGRLISDPIARAAMIRQVSPFGDGRASERICDAIGRTLRSSDQIAQPLAQLTA